MAEVQHPYGALHPVSHCEPPYKIHHDVRYQKSSEGTLHSYVNPNLGH